MNKNVNKDINNSKLLQNVFLKCFRVVVFLNLACSNKETAPASLPAKHLNNLAKEFSNDARETYKIILSEYHSSFKGFDFDITNLNLGEYKNFPDIKNSTARLFSQYQQSLDMLKFTTLENTFVLNHIKRLTAKNILYFARLNTLWNNEQKSKSDTSNLVQHEQGEISNLVQHEQGEISNLVQHEQGEISNLVQHEQGEISNPTQHEQNHF